MQFDGSGSSDPDRRYRPGFLHPVLIGDTPWESGGSGPYLYGTIMWDYGKLRIDALRMAVEQELVIRMSTYNATQVPRVTKYIEPQILWR